MKKNRRKNKNGQEKNTVVPALPDGLYEDKKHIGHTNSSLMLSAYSLVNSNFHSSLNTIASVILMTDSAFAFTAITLNVVNIFSYFMSIYALSLSFYILSVVSNLKSKNTIAKYIIEGNDDISFIIGEIESSHKYNFRFIGIFILFSCVFLLLISDQISSYILKKL